MRRGNICQSPGQARSRRSAGNGTARRGLNKVECKMRRHFIVLVVLSIVGAVSCGLAHAADPPPSTTPTTRPSALDSVIPELQLDSVPLEQSLDMLADKTHANIIVNWTAIEAAGVSRKTPIRVHLWNVPLHTALSVVLQVASDKIELLYAMQDGLIHVSTTDEMEG
jgi:hypothetical protein